MRQLVLIRHSSPEYDPEQPACLWRLSEAGRRRCVALAERLAAYDLTTLVTSTEPKAIETGQIVAGILAIRCDSAPGLHEHERPEAAGTADRERFQASVARLFRNPGELVLGTETADAAHARFAAAIARVGEECPSGNLGIVSHGTVMSLLISRANSFDPYPFWAGLGLPAFAVLRLPGLALLEIVDVV